MASDKPGGIPISSTMAPASRISSARHSACADPLAHIVGQIGKVDGRKYLRVDTEKLIHNVLILGGCRAVYHYSRKTVQTIAAGLTPTSAIG